MDDKTMLTINRVLGAPIDRVWAAWSNPDEIQQWWGPKGVTNPTCVWECQTGGKINIVMLAGKEMGSMAGAEWPMTGEFTEVVPQEKIAFSCEAIADGKPILENETTVTFSADGPKTNMTVVINVTKITEEGKMALQGMEAGWNQQLDKLSERVSKDK